MDNLSILKCFNKYFGAKFYSVYKAYSGEVIDRDVSKDPLPFCEGYILEEKELEIDTIKTLGYFTDAQSHYNFYFLETLFLNYHCNINEKLFDIIFSNTLTGKSLRFEMAYNHGPPHLLNYNNGFFSKDIALTFEDWANNQLSEDLVAYDLYSGGEFEFFLLNGGLAIAGKTEFCLDLDEVSMRVKDLLTDEVLKVLFNIDEVKQINTEDIYLEFEFIYNFKSHEWTINCLEQSYHNINGLSDFDFSTINLSRLKSLLYQNIKTFSDKDKTVVASAYAMEHSNLEYQKGVSVIYVSGGTNINISETISYTFPVLKT